MNRPSRREVVVFLLVSTALLVWSSAPDWAGYAAQNSQVAFSGTYFDPQDYAVYLAMIRAGMAGAWGYSLRFTTEAQPTVYIRLFYVLLGELNRVIQVSPATLYEVCRWLFGYSALWAVYLLIRRSFPGAESHWRWLAFFIVVAGSGLGWLQRSLNWVPGPITPVDYWLIDAYFLFSLSLFPHFAVTLTLMCLALVEYLDFLDGGSWVRLALVIVAALVVQVVNPIAFLVVDVALAATTVVHVQERGPGVRRAWLALAITAAAQLPLLAYSVFVIARLPIWAEFFAQNQTPSPPPIYYLWGFGLMWPLAAAGAASALRQRDQILIASLAWVIAAFGLAYVPLPIQRRFLLGITIPLGLLATRGLADACAALATWRPNISPRLPGLAMLTATVLAITTLTLEPAHAFHALSRPPEIFYPRALDAGFTWISHNSGANDAFMSSGRTGLLIAQMTGRRVFIGHEMETLYYSQKSQEVAEFYSRNSNASPIPLAGVKWVFYGPYEQALYPDFRPGQELVPVFQGEGVSIFENEAYAGG